MNRRAYAAAFLFLAVALLIFGSRASADAPTDSQFPIPDSRLSISLLTVGPGAIYWERFGHNAILVRDRAAGTAIAYNYGIFDFDEDDFFLNFARGRMRYRIAADPLAFDLDMYREESRSITEQRLAFTPAEASALRDFLVWNAQPEHAYYRYDYFVANCSTRVRDALDQALGGAIRRATEGRSRGYTYRMDALRLMAAEPALMLVIDLGLGPFADRRIDFWQESFVPASLMSAMRDVRVTEPDGTTKPLVAEERTIARGTVAEPPELPPDFRWPFLAIGIAIGFAIFAARGVHSLIARIPATTFVIMFELFCGLGGLVLLVLWLLTDHRAAWRNENLLLLNPLCLALIPALIRSARRRTAGRWSTRIAWLVAALAAFALFSKILPWFVQANLHWILLMLPIHAAIALLLARSAQPNAS